jgi:hypothetical protein
MKTAANAEAGNSTILTAADPGWDEARLAWNLTADQRPAAIARPGSPQSVADAVGYARSHGLRVAAARHGLAALTGTSPDVGVVGYTVGGGMSWLGRKYGLAAGSAEAFGAVTADGRLLRADPAHERDLFWALRGGGGSFAVVTAIELRLFPVADLCAGLLWWPIAAAPDVLHAWQDLTCSGLPDEFTTTARLMRFPDFPQVPGPIRGGAFIVIDVVHLGSQAEADQILAPLRALRPATDTVHVIPPRELGYLHMDPEQPTPGVGDGLLLDTLPAAAVDRLIGLAGPGADNVPNLVEIRHIGGQMRRRRPGAGALPAIDAGYVLLGGSAVTDPQLAAEMFRGVHAIATAMTPWAARQMYLNFAETRRDPASFWDPQAYSRLRQIKTAVDPEDRIQSNHPVPPAPAN